MREQGFLRHGSQIRAEHLCSLSSRRASEHELGSSVFPRLTLSGIVQQFSHQRPARGIHPGVVRCQNAMPLRCLHPMACSHSHAVKARIPQCLAAARRAPQDSLAKLLEASLFGFLSSSKRHSPSLLQRYISQLDYLDFIGGFCMWIADSGTVAREEGRRLQTVARVQFAHPTQMPMHMTCNC